MNKLIEKNVHFLCEVFFIVCDKKKKQKKVERIIEGSRVIAMTQRNLECRINFCHDCCSGRKFNKCQFVNERNFRFIFGNSETYSQKHCIIIITRGVNIFFHFSERMQKMKTTWNKGGSHSIMTSFVGKEKEE